MHILIIGAAGMVGRKLTSKLVAEGGADRLTLVDVVAPEAPAGFKGKVTAEAADTYTRAMLPALAQSGTAAERLRIALGALCATADQHLHVLAGFFLAGGEVFHQPGPDAMVVEVFAEPFERLLRDGAVDGSLRHLSPTITATVLFNLVGWGYIHLRAAHGWGASITAEAIIDLVLHGALSALPPTSA